MNEVQRQETPAVLAWHAMPATDVLMSLDSRASGLSTEEAARRLAREVSVVRASDLRPWTVLFARQFQSPFVLILSIALGISIFFSEWLEAGVTFLVVVINALLGFVQEYKADRALAALRAYMPATVTVRRAGDVIVIPANEVVVGDVLILAGGDRVPADARLLSAAFVAVDESSLTGESQPVGKDVPPLSPDVGVADRTCMVYAGTSVVTGRAEAVVTALGEGTEFGRISSLATSTAEAKTPLEQEIAAFSVWIARGVTVVALVLLGIGIWRELPFPVMFSTTAALAIAAVPEGLLISVTFVLAAAMRRMLARHVLVRRLSAVETLGAASVLCVDKTGTITTGKMTVTEMTIGVRSVPLMDASERAVHMRSLLRLLVESSPGKAVAGSLTDAAIASFVKDQEKVGVVIRRLPFDPAHRFAAAQFRKDDRAGVAVVGAPDTVLRQCDLRDDEMRALRAHVEEMAQRGLRVLAVAEGESVEFSVAGIRDLRIVGFLGVEDPLRPSVAPAVALARNAGIRTVMITGDHAETALAIARQAGIAEAEGDVVTGRALAEMSDEEVSAVVERISVFARVLPEQKLRIVHALQARKHVVAMTGDGVNDAPALKAADIGVAVKHATDVARETSDIVLLDSDFAHIVSAVAEGRHAFTTVRRVTVFLVSFSFIEALIVAGSLILGTPLPLLPLQILWINLVTDGIPAMSLAFEPPQAQAMLQRPRRKGAGILDLSTTSFVFGCTVVSAAIPLAAMWYLQFFVEWTVLQTWLYLFVGLSGIVVIFIIRDLSRPMFLVNPMRNPYLLFASALSFGLILAPVFLPVLHGVFSVTSMTTDLWVWVGGALLILLGLIEGFKAVGYHK